MNSDFLIALIADGSHDIKINGKTYSMNSGDLLMLPPNMIARYEGKFPEHQVKRLMVPIETIMELPSPFDTDLVSMTRRMPVLHPDSEDFSALSELWEMIESTYSENDSIYKVNILKSLLFALLYRVGNLYAKIRPDEKDALQMRQEQLSDDFFMLLSQHYRSDRTVKFYADKMALTPKYLSKAIRKITGRSVHEWIDEAIILEMKNLLKTTDKTILEISEELNFCTPSAFVQFFKQHVGSTPHKYRKSEEW